MIHYEKYILNLVICMFTRLISAYLSVSSEILVYSTHGDYLYNIYKSIDFEVLFKWSDHGFVTTGLA